MVAERIGLNWLLWPVCDDSLPRPYRSVPASDPSFLPVAPTPEPSVSEIETLVAMMMSKQLQQMTEELYHIADSALAANRQVFERARQDAERSFKGEKFFKAEELFKVL